MTRRANPLRTPHARGWRLVFLLCVIAVAAPAAAQDASGDPPAHISHVEGTAVLERDGGTESAPRAMPLLAGDRVRTADGRLEILFGDGSTLHLDARTIVDFQSDEVIRLLDGRVRLNIVGPTRQVAYRIDAPAAWVQIDQPGEYRVALVRGEQGSEVELAVIRGAAELVNESGRTALRAGERAYASAGLAPSHPYVFNSAAWDSFDRWSEGRREQRLGHSAQYLPTPVRPYAATLDHYGRWEHLPTYGYVWYPSVAAGWRPYYHGRWATLRPFGWTWIGADPWAWPTHHFGRWGFSAGVWFWIPGRHWGPAWVSWAHAPGFVAWAPLGFHNRPVLSIVNVNVIAGHRFDPWRAWTVIPHSRFGRGSVHVNVVNITRIDARVRGSFVERHAPPEIRGIAVPRSSAPIRVAGTRSGASAPFDGTRGAASRDVTIGARSGYITAPDSRSAIRRQPGTAEADARTFPAPAREPGVPSATRTPRDPAATRQPGTGVAVPRASERSAPVPEQNRTTEAASTPSAEPAARQPVRRSAVPVSPGSSEPVRRAAPARSGSEGTTQPQAAPSREPSAEPPGRQPVRRSAVPVSPGSSEPARRAAPARPGSEGTTQPQAAPSREPRVYGPARAPGAAAPATAPATSGSDARGQRAVPRRDGGGVAPPAGAVQPNRSIRQAPSQPALPPSSYQRAVPRSAAPATAPQQARPGPGVERRAPAVEQRSGRPPSAAPPPSATRPAAAQPSAGPSRSSAPASAGPSRSGDSPRSAAPSRSRGDQPSRGAATRRGGGN